jgi:hypothetical protein
MKALLDGEVANGEMTQEEEMFLLEKAMGEEAAIRDREVAELSKKFMADQKQKREQFDELNARHSIRSSGDSLFFVERIRNRFNSSCEFSGGSAYRDFGIKVAIGVQVSTEGRCIFVPVKEWLEETSWDGSLRRNKNVRLFTCEIPLHHRGIQLEDEMHAARDNYVAMRNLVSS